MATPQTPPAGGQGIAGAGGGAGLPAHGATQVGGAGQSAATGGSAPGPEASHAASTAMVPMDAAHLEELTQSIDQERLSINPIVARLPVELDVTVPVREFRVRDLLSLEPGQVIESQWGHGDDVPLAAGEVALAWSEFEVVDTQLAVRITRLS